MLRLIITHGNEEQVFAVPEPEARLGSASENDFVVRAPGVSRRHALVRRVSGGVEVVDLGSKNGLVAEGERVAQMILTPGGWLQIGAAWLGIEEISTSHESLALMLDSPIRRTVPPPFTTETLTSHGDLASRSPADAALALACYIAEAGAGLPGTRGDLLLRIKETIGAEVFASFERTRHGILRILESEDSFSPEERKILGALAQGGGRPAIPDQVILKRAGRLLLAGREPWFLGARFAEESCAQEGWRKDFLRFLTHEFFAPVRNIDDLNVSEAVRVLALARGNKRKAAALLGISPGTLYKLLSGRVLPKR